MRFLLMVALWTPSNTWACKPINNACLECRAGQWIAKTQAWVRVLTTERGVVTSAVSVLLAKGERLLLKPNQRWRCESALTIPPETPVDTDNPSLQELAYSKGHKSLFCRLKGYATARNESCVGRIQGCATMPLQLMGYSGGHKTRFCAKRGYEGYQPGGRPGYCFRGQGCASRLKPRFHECRFTTVGENWPTERACSSLDKPIIHKDLNYAGGHKTWFCRAKGYQTVQKDRCIGRLEGCYTLPLELMGYRKGHKTKYCQRSGFDGYQPGGRWGYCYRGAACGARPQVGKNEKKFKTR